VSRKNRLLAIRAPLVGSLEALWSAREGRHIETLSRFANAA
jgi:hypothetical protein